MTDVFLSYSSKDRAGENDRISPVVELLEGQGFSVFWDQKVPPGVDWDEWIRKKLTDAKCAVVLWSNESVQSNNVRHEATIALKHDKLVSVLIDPLDAEQFPMGLYTHQAIQLSDWTGGHDDPPLLQLLREVEAKHEPHAPLWVQRVIDGLQADRDAERSRVRRAENRAKELQRKLDRSAEAALEAERDRESAIEESADARQRLEKVEAKRSEREARYAAFEQRLKDAERERDDALKASSDLKAEVADVHAARGAAEARLTETEQRLKDVEAQAEELSKQLKDATESHAPPNSKSNKAAGDQPGKPGGKVGFTILTGIVAVALFIFAANLPGLRFGVTPDLGMTRDLTLAVTVAFLTAALLLLWRRWGCRGSSERALMWLAIAAPIGVMIAPLLGLSHTDGFLAGIAFLGVTALVTAVRPGRATTGRAFAVYWFGTWLPAVVAPNGVISIYEDWTGAYTSDGTPYFVFVGLVVALGLAIYLVWRATRRPSKPKHEAMATAAEAS